MTKPNSSTKSKNTRRTFIKTSAAVAAGALLSRGSTVRAAETLAVKGGKPTVTFSKDKVTQIVKWPQYEPEDREAILHILEMEDGKMYGHLPALDKEWCEFNGVPFARAHCNGTGALTTMYFTCDFPPGSEIMVPSYTFYGTIIPMRFFGYVPIFIDIDPKTACFDIEDAKRKLTPRTKALVPMHSWGMPCEMDKITAFAKEHGLLVLEDAAHAHGASMQGKKMGAWGDMAIFSFQATKPLPGIEGGMGTYQTREQYERASTFMEYKAPDTFPEDSPFRKYKGTAFGFKFRIHPLAAALVRRQIKAIDPRNALIYKQVRTLNDRICKLPGISEPFCRPDQQRVYYSANVIFLDEAAAGISRTAMVKALKAEGVLCESGDYPEQHKNTIYREEKWWHHKPIVTDLPGTTSVNDRAVNVRLARREAPELIEQYAQAFEKVWAHRKELA